jgi:hypothetical protein
VHKVTCNRKYHIIMQIHQRILGNIIVMAAHYIMGDDDSRLSNDQPLADSNDQSLANNQPPINPQYIVVEINDNVENLLTIPSHFAHLTTSNEPIGLMTNPDMIYVMYKLDNYTRILSFSKTTMANELKLGHLQDRPDITWSVFFKI